MLLGPKRERMLCLSSLLHSERCAFLNLQFVPTKQLYQFRKYYSPLGLGTSLPLGFHMHEMFCKFTSAFHHFWSKPLSWKGFRFTCSNSNISLKKFMCNRSRIKEAFAQVWSHHAGPLFCKFRPSPSSVLLFRSLTRATKLVNRIPWTRKWNAKYTCEICNMSLTLAMLQFNT